ncbi:MAG: lyase family protein [Solirubrobacteraceae bacterium]
MTSDLFTGLYARGSVAAELTGEAWLQAMLDVEAALARACAAERLIPTEAAEAIAAACVAERFDAGSLARDAAEHATPVLPLVAALREAVGERHARHVHLGSTSQDILDTALMLLARRALKPLLADAGGAAGAAARLADRHRATPMIGRTLLQQALPVTFGLRAAGWLAGIDAASARLDQIRDSELAVQMGGPVGARPPAVAARVAAGLELAEPVLPWPAIRVRPAVLASALGVLGGVLAKVARDVTLLAAQELGEVSEGGEPGRGGSTAIAHKHNPVAAVSVLACSKRVPGLVTTVLACMEQEHERAAGAWQAEWGVQTELLGLVGSAAAWCRELLEDLQVNPARMRANLDAATAADDEAGACAELIDRAIAEHRRRIADPPVT